MSFKHESIVLLIPTSKVPTAIDSADVFLHAVVMMGL